MTRDEAVAFHRALRERGWVVVDAEVIEAINDWNAGSMPFDPYEVYMDYQKQERHYHCHGCAAVGKSSWPEWELTMQHEANCLWLRYRAMLEAVR